METNYAIQEFVARKNFDELTESERKFVLANISQEEYTLKREIVISMAQITKEDLEILHPSPNIKHIVYKRMEQNKQSASGVLEAFVGFLNRPIPAYAFSLPIFILLFALTWMLNPEEQPNEVAEVPSSVMIIDTVFITKEVPIEIEVVKEVTKAIQVPVIKYVDRYETKVDYNQVTFSESSDDAYDALVEAESRFSDQLEQIGKSAAENDELDQFLTGVR
jgi:hypothetical protein